ncbi:MAG TPA: hypothetical protein EYP85_03720 [Armatimonadetes bacterium]|nr:hypothetical protein [Armatimonadota bacterium]
MNGKLMGFLLVVLGLTIYGCGGGGEGKEVSLTNEQIESRFVSLFEGFSADQREVENFVFIPTRSPRTEVQDETRPDGTQVHTEIDYDNGTDIELRRTLTYPDGSRLMLRGVRASITPELEITTVTIQFYNSQGQLVTTTAQWVTIYTQNTEAREDDKVVVTGTTTWAVDGSRKIFTQTFFPDGHDELSYTDRDGTQCTQRTEAPDEQGNRAFSGQCTEPDGVRRTFSGTWGRDRKSLHWHSDSSTGLHEDFNLNEDRSGDYTLKHDTRLLVSVTWNSEGEATLRFADGTEKPVDLF